jgi:hypothetical protein
LNAKNNAPSRKERTVRIRPESAGNLLCVELSGAVTEKDHEEFIVSPVRQILKKYPSNRYLAIFMPDFKGWMPSAAESNMKIIIECARSCERLAYVNPPKRKILQIKLSKPLLKCPVRFFNTAQLDEALTWIRED